MIDLNDFNAAFFDGSFDEEVLYTPSGGQGKPVRAIFDNEYQAAQFNDANTQVESSGPRATCREVDVAGVAHGDTIQIRGITYFVTEVHPDGTGLVVLILSKDT